LFTRIHKVEQKVKKVEGNGCMNVIPVLYHGIIVRSRCKCK